MRAVCTLTLMNTTKTAFGVTVNTDSLAALAAIKAAREARTMCATHPAFEADYCPTCGTAQVI
jgi:hypothetical protein